jgi:DNA repair exonuclease SbcCD ATPase subunit
MTADQNKMFDALEKRIEKLADRHRTMAEEIGKLKTKLAERDAELDKVRQEAAASRKNAQKSEELSAELARCEAEKQKVRERIARLIETLETIDPSGA